MDASILIAEDDADIRDLLRLYLEGEGFCVLEAGDGASRPCALPGSSRPAWPLWTL